MCPFPFFFTVKFETNMETTTLLDFVVGGLAFVVLIGGLVMLFNGIFAFGDQDK